MLNAENVNLRFFDNSISGRFQRFIRHLETYQNHRNRWMFLVIKRRIRDWIYLIFFNDRNDKIGRHFESHTRETNVSPFVTTKWDCAWKKSQKNLLSLKTQHWSWMSAWLTQNEIFNSCCFYGGGRTLRRCHLSRNKTRPVTKEEKKQKQIKHFLPGAKHKK